MRLLLVKPRWEARTRVSHDVALPPPPAGDVGGSCRSSRRNPAYKCTHLCS